MTRDDLLPCMRTALSGTPLTSSDSIQLGLEFLIRDGSLAFTGPCRDGGSSGRAFGGGSGGSLGARRRVGERARDGCVARFPLHRGCFETRPSCTVRSDGKKKSGVREGMGEWGEDSNPG